MSWTAPAVMQALVNLVVLVAVGLAALGKLRDGRFHDQEMLIQLRGEQVKALEDKVDMMEEHLAGMTGQFKAHTELTELSEASLRAEIAQLQKLNLNLQKQLDVYTQSSMGRIP